MPRETTRQASATKRVGGTGPVHTVARIAEKPASPPANQFPVAVIGASAGGQEAVTALLKALPSSTGMAFVLIQHLEPNHNSALATILSKATSMPVVEVSSGVSPKPDHVYVVPPNKSTTLRKGVLRLSPRVSASGPEHPIDRFAVSLAKERGSGAIGVVLAGTGSDGTQGLKAIKAAGGITFAQDPKTTRWPGMPVSAISANAADSVLSPKRIAAELARIGRHPYMELIHLALDESRRTGDYARAIVETIREGLVVLDSNLCVVTANRTFTELFGCSLKELQRRPLLGTGAGQIEAPPLRKLLRNVMKKGTEVRNFELDHLSGSGPLHLLVNARLIETSATILLVVQDISTRKQAEKELDKVEAALREQRTLLDKTVVTAPGAVYAVRRRPDGSLSMPYAAPSFARMIPELPDMREDLTPLFAMMHPDDVERVRASMAKSARTLKPWGDEYRLVTRNRGTLWFESRSVPERERDGSVQWYGFLTEITDRKRIEQELIQSRQQQNSMLDNSPYAIARFDRDLRYRYVNARLLEAAGTPESGFIGKRIDNVGLPRDLVKTWRSSLRRTLDTGQQAVSEFTYPTPSGETWWESRVVPEFGLDGSVQSVLSFSIDVTERRKAESALRQSDERLRMAIESTEMGTFETNYLTGELSWSAMAKRQFGLTPEAALNVEGLRDMIHPSDRGLANSVFAPGWRSRQNTNRDFATEYRVTGADGRERWLSSWGRVFFGKDGHPTRSIGVRLDITERKRMEEALRERDAITANLFEAAAQGIVAINTNGIVRFVNNMTTNLFGYKREEIVGQPLSVLIPEAARAKHAGNHASYFDAPQNRPMGLGLHLSARHKNGSTFPVEVGLSVIKTSEGSLAVAFVTDITERQRLEQVAREHADEVQALAASLLTAQEDERRRVSRELHDQICQQLASLAMDAGSLAAEGELPHAVQQRMKELQSRAVRASEEARHIAYQLHPSVIDDLGVTASLRELCRDFSRETHVPAEFKGNVQKSLVPREIASCLYRVTQEGLHNIAKHSRAKHVTVELAVRSGNVELSIRDDGAGFDYAAVKGRGLGLVGMEERARLVRGKLSIAARDGRGTHIFLAVPLPAGEL